MISLRSEYGYYGPFRSAEKVGAAWVCDGITYPTSVIGNASLVDGYFAPQPAAQIVPRSVSMFAMRVALYKSALLESVEGFFSNAVGEEADIDRIKWATSLIVQRDDRLATVALPAMNQSEVDIDSLFVAAGQIDRSST